MAYDVPLEGWQANAQHHIKNVGAAIGICDEAVHNKPLLEFIHQMGLYLGQFAAVKARVAAPRSICARARARVYVCVCGDVDAIVKCGVGKLVLFSSYYGNGVLPCPWSSKQKAILVSYL